jgi:hypothetical protein
MCLKIQRNSSSRNCSTMLSHKNWIKKQMMWMILKIFIKIYKNRQSKRKYLLKSLKPGNLCMCLNQFTNSILMVNNLLIKFPKVSIQVANRNTICNTIKTLQFNRQKLKIMRSSTPLTISSPQYIIAEILFTPVDF